MWHDHSAIVQAGPRSGTVPGRWMTQVAVRTKPSHVAALQPGREGPPARRVEIVYVGPHAGDQRILVWKHGAAQRGRIDLAGSLLLGRDMELVDDLRLCGRQAEPEDQGRDTCYNHPANRVHIGTAMETS